LNINVKKEACPLGLAPTASTTVTMTLGDALAVAMLESRGFTENDFAMVHPAGSLGKKLLLRVSDIMHSEQILIPERASPCSRYCLKRVDVSELSKNQTNPDLSIS